MKNLKNLNWALAVALLTLGSCDSDDNKSNTNDQKSSGISMSLITSGAAGTEYIVSKEDVMSGEISAQGTGIEQTGWRFYYPVGKTLFASGFSTDNQCAGYAANNEGVIQLKGQFIFENSLEMFGKSDDNKTLLAMEIPRVGFANRRLHFINVDNVSVQKIVGTKIFSDEANKQVAWPTALEVRSDKLFIPYHVLDSEGNFSTLDANKAYVAVYSYPNVGTTPEKIISDDRTSNIGLNGGTTGLIETESGDLYSFSCGTVSAGFSTASTKPSGILKIKAQTTEFDKDYFFNIETATNGGKIFWFDYIGGNKALARILKADTNIPWDAFSRSQTAFNQKLVIIDLVAKTVTDVANVPLHAKRYTSPVFIQDGKVYESIETETEAYVYQIDIATATGKKGAKIVGQSIKGFYKL
ncbi:DUF4374 domain-containing protein [Flavobacterium sp.]|uniref:DUF4374 domain-containing protein n=1 Tax=Flavobacterium sp. TaxID=239 RepID=UPI0022C65614|nr:DUF4374 domain-containing protein [Flavobacterium sp.]MCZ8228202.1 DUF4374 domain-containing protein [Flavobacterium sp.]